MDRRSKESHENRPTHAEVEIRIKQVQDDLLNGLTKSEILKRCDQWKISVRQIEEYMSRARENIREVNKEEIEDTIAMLHLNYLELFRQSKNEGDLKEAHAVLNSIAKLKGAYEIKITKTIISKFDGMSDDDFDEAIDGEFGKA